MTLHLPPPDPPALVNFLTGSREQDGAQESEETSDYAPRPGSRKAFVNTAKLETSVLVAQRRLATLKSQSSTSPGSFDNLGLRLEQTEATHLITQERQGEKREFQLPLGDRQENRPVQPNQPANVEKVDLVEVVANQQEYDDRQQVITAKGNVVMRFAQAVLTADRLQINLVDRIAVAQGKVVLKRGEQVLRGERFEYYFVQDRGTVTEANGEVYQPSLTEDTTPSAPVSESSGIIPGQSLSDRLSANQPLQRITTSEGYQFVAGSKRDFNLLSGRGGVDNPGAGGIVNRLRFQADKLDFDGDNWRASKIRVTNDPFSPPELEVRADAATLQQTTPQANRLKTKGSRIVLDQKARVPLLFANDFTFDRRPQQPGLFRFAFDGDERGGLFIERNFRVIDNDVVSLKFKPQYYLQRVLSGNGDILGASVFGLDTNFSAVVDPRTNFLVRASIFGFDNFEENIKGKVTLARKLGDLNRPFDLKLEYGYRERLFNGSLGFQRVRSRLGVELKSPELAIADTGVRLNFLGSIQNINAETDRERLLSIDRNDDRINLTRYLASASLNRDFPLWEGKALPATKDEGLRYTATPVLPYIQLIAGIDGTSSWYSNGDTQQFIRGKFGIEGQFGHFSRSYLDYTGFRIEYSQGIVGKRSPFRFDRFVDERTLSVGIIQQIYGPIRVGIQTAWNLDDKDEISTDYILEYSRRTHKVVLRYNPVLEIGSISFNISDFNWSGDPEPFDSGDL
jgi:hypothetical protein